MENNNFRRSTNPKTKLDDLKGKDKTVYQNNARFCVPDKAMCSERKKSYFAILPDKELFDSVFRIVTFVVYSLNTD